MSFFIVSQNKDKRPIEIFKIDAQDALKRNLPMKNGWFYMPATFDNLGRVASIDHLDETDKHKRWWMNEHDPVSTYDTAVLNGIYDLWCNI